MGFFSKIKNTLTGDWAEVTVQTANAKRGNEMSVQVHVQVHSNDIDVQRIYVKVRCSERIHANGVAVDIPTHLLRNDDYDNDDGMNNNRSNVRVDVHEHDTLYDHEFTIANGEKMTTGNNYDYSANLPLPAQLPPTFRGRLSEIQWQLFAGLDMRGNDPDSGWLDIEVE
ncbi:MAG: hypothetical protein R8L53_06055 [Mariprofundales bacterium]